MDLFPGGVLRQLSETGLGTVPSAPQRPAGEGSPQAANARLARERIQGSIDSDLARERVRAGLISPVWRELETGVAELFQPPEALVRSGHSSMTLGARFGNQVSSAASQILGSPGQVESGTLARGAYAERGPTGMREDGFRSGRAAQQTTATVDAWGKPASWRRTEVELTITASGEVESVRVINPCGVKKLDELAAETIEKAARRLLGGYRGKRTVTTWAFASSYAASVPIGVTMDPNRAADVIGVHGGFSFDESGLARKKARGVGKYLSDPEHPASGKLHTKVSLLSLHELSE